MDLADKGGFRFSQHEHLYITQGKYASVETNQFLYTRQSATPRFPKHHFQVVVQVH